MLRYCGLGVEERRWAAFWAKETNYTKSQLCGETQHTGERPGILPGQRSSPSAHDPHIPSPLHPYNSGHYTGGNVLSLKSRLPVSLVATRGQVTQFQITRPSGTLLGDSATVLLSWHRGVVLSSLLLPSLFWLELGGEAEGGAAILWPWGIQDDETEK